MAWDDVLAAVGGAAGGADNAIRYWDKREGDLEVARARMETQIELQNLKNILAAYGIDTRAGTAESVARIGANSREAVAGTQAASAGNVATIGATSREAVAAGQNASREKVADANRESTDERFWGGTMPLGWSRVSTIERGQDMTSRDRRYGVDVGAATSQSNADLAAAASQRNADVRAGSARLGISARANLFGPTAQTDTELPPPPVTRAPAPVAPRGSAPPAAPRGAAAPKVVTMQELQRVAAKNGTTVAQERQRAEREGYTVR